MVDLTAALLGLMWVSRLAAAMVEYLAAWMAQLMAEKKVA